MFSLHPLISGKKRKSEGKLYLAGWALVSWRRAGRASSCPAVEKTKGSLICLQNLSALWGPAFGTSELGERQVMSVPPPYAFKLFHSHPSCRHRHFWCPWKEKAGSGTRPMVQDRISPTQSFPTLSSKARSNQEARAEACGNHKTCSQLSGEAAAGLPLRASCIRTILTVTWGGEDF